MIWRRKASTEKRWRRETSPAAADELDEEGRRRPSWDGRRRRDLEERASTGVEEGAATGLGRRVSAGG